MVPTQAAERRSPASGEGTGIMADEVRIVEYYYTEVPDRPGNSAKVLNALRAARVNLLAYTAFPTRPGRAQIDFVPVNTNAFLNAARKAGLNLVGPKSAFLVQGRDRVGAVAEIATKLAEAHINITALDGVTAGGRRFGAILWVKPRNIPRAARVLAAS